MNFIVPNQFQLSGPGLHVAYSTSGLNGKPHFGYLDNNISKSFSGNAIRKVDSDLGTIVSVTIHDSTDAGSTTFSVLIPKVHLNPNEVAQLDTQGITTIHRLSIIPTLNHGQIDLYTVTALKGTAQYVTFLA